MKIQLKKMKTQLKNGIAKYYLDNLCINDFIGKKVSLNFSNEINCLSCNKKIKKTYSQGYCFQCMRSLPECDICIVKPELCHYTQGTCRDSSWGEKNCLQGHIVYLSNTGAVKVGITREKNIPSRWIDQGATQALPIFWVKNRLLSGLVETIFKKHIADKTNWRKMLQGIPTNENLKEKFATLFELVKENIANLKKVHGDDAIKILDNDATNIEFSILEYPTKITSLNFDKNPNINGKLLGIKAQYLIFDTGVINIRKFGGYWCKIIAE